MYPFTPQPPCAEVGQPAPGTTGAGSHLRARPQARFGPRVLANKMTLSSCPRASRVQDGRTCGRHGGRLRRSPRASPAPSVTAALPPRFCPPPGLGVAMPPRRASIADNAANDRGAQEDLCSSYVQSHWTGGSPDRLRARRFWEEGPAAATRPSQAQPKVYFTISFTLRLCCPTFL